MRVKVLLLAVLLTIGIATSANAAIIFSDGFNGIGDQVSFTTVNNGGSIGPWTVGGSGVDWIGIYWQPQEGDGSVDLSALGAGSVSTVLPTIAGQSYDLSFYLSGNPVTGNVIKQMQVSAGDLNTIYNFNTSGISTSAMGWTLISATFLAAGNDTLTFTSLENNAAGPALDNVTVSDHVNESSAVPEPATFLLGFAGLATLALFRRKK
ncbi:MAG: choice-of-anchor C family protein [Bryobacterales bacterium]|nr:choice-of-anchor C family protein [Bryobacterales bacterium]